MSKVLADLVWLTFATGIFVLCAGFGVATERLIPNDPRSDEAIAFYKGAALVSVLLACAFVLCRLLESA